MFDHLAYRYITFTVAFASGWTTTGSVLIGGALAVAEPLREMRTLARVMPTLDKVRLKVWREGR